jgi:beta-xylosidase
MSWRLTLIFFMLPPVASSIEILVKVEGETMESPTASMQHYSNPLNVQIADPFVFRHEGIYYLYGTYEPDANLGVPVMTSKDLANWTWRGFALEKTQASWGQVHYWGPEVVRVKDHFYMYYNASPNKTPEPPFNMHLCIAESNSPLGPFKELKAPFYQPEGEDEAIDQNVFIDTDGQAYIYFTQVTQGRNDIRAVKLKDTMTEFDGEPVLCIRSTEPWERRPWENHLVAEGAFVVKRKGLYYLTYTANHFMDPHYAFGYATSEHPLGPWHKFSGNPFLARTEFVAGPGNGMLVPSPDGSEMFMVYHTHQSPRELGWRQLAIDRARFVEQETGPNILIVDGPTHLPQPLPAGAPHPPRGGSDDFLGEKLDRDRWFVINEVPEDWWLEDGHLALRTHDGDMWKQRGDFKNLILQYTPEGDFRIETRVVFAAQKEFEQAFLCVWQDHDNYVRLSVLFDEGPRLQAACEREGRFEQMEIENTLGNEVYLRIQKQEDRYTLCASGDGRAWQTVGDGYDAPLLHRRVGIGAIAPGSGRHPVAVFDYFSIE